MELLGVCARWRGCPQRQLCMWSPSLSLLHEDCWVPSLGHLPHLGQQWARLAHGVWETLSSGADLTLRMWNEPRPHPLLGFGWGEWGLSEKGPSLLLPSVGMGTWRAEREPGLAAP